MIDRFTKKQFEEALPEESEYLGLVQGEHVYALPIADSAARIVIRSTINENGVAADTGDDSIRLWIEVLADSGEWKSFSKMKDELGAYTTRVPGWDRRMGEKIEALARVAEKFRRPVSACPDCGEHTLRISKTDRNPNRPFAGCWNRQHRHFEWLDEPLEIPKTRIVEKSKSAFDDASDNGDLFSELEGLFVSEPAPQASDEPVIERPQLNNQQSAIVMAPIEGAMRVLAGPGAGKTRINEERIARLVLDGDAEPGQILYVVFNKSMADEGAERIGKRLLSLGIDHNRVEQYKAWFCTIHAACFRILRDDPGFDRQVPKNWELNKTLKEIAVDLWPYSSDTQNGRPSANELHNAICNAKYRCYNYREAGPWYTEMWGDYHGERLKEAHRRFDMWLGNKYIVFPEMLYLVERNLRIDREFREKWQSRFKWVMIDEAQDTSGQAMRILSTLAQPEGNFMVTGDTDQLLYRFSGATPEENLYDGFSQRFPDGMTFFLETNYRSVQSVIDASNKLIHYNYAEGGGPYDDGFKKNLIPREDAGEGAPITFQMYESAEEEAWAVAQEIKNALDTGERVPGEYFVPARTKAQLGFLEPVMTAMGVPFVNITGGSFWLMRHVRQTVSYLRLAHDASDSGAFKDIYNVASENMKNPWGKQQGEYSSTRWLGRQFLYWCGERMDNIQRTQYGYKSNGGNAQRGWMTGLDDLFDTMINVEEELRLEGPRAALQWVIEHVMTRYLREEDELGDDENSYKLDDLATVAEVAGKFDNVEKFLDYIDKAIQAAEDSKNKNWGDYVVLSTIHRLKGLERPVVFGIGWCEGYNEKTSQPVGLLPHTYALTDPPRKGPLDMASRNSVEDERCIAFVCVSRAKEEVHLSGMRQWRGAMMGPSRFVHEALESVGVKDDWIGIT